MEENNSSDENNQNGPGSEIVPDNTPPVAGETFHPETASQPETVPMAEPPASEPSGFNAPDAKPELLSVPPRPLKKKSKKGLLLILLFLLLLVAGGVAYQYVYRNSTEETSKVVETKEVEQIRIGSIDGPANNIFPKEGIGISYTMNRQIYEGLVASKNGKYLPLLAASWTNPNEKTWVFKLKPGVKFQSGKAFTAADVKASIEGLKQLDFLGYVTSTIDKIEVVSDLEVKITTSEPDALLLNRLAIAYISDSEAKDSVGNNGTGPYMLDKTATYNETTATLVPFDSYHQGRPKTRKLIYTIYETDLKMNAAIKENKIDMMDTISNADAIAGLSDAGFAKLEFESPGTFGIYMNMLRANSPLKNKEVRKALAQAVNRQALINELKSNNEPRTQVVPKSLPGYDASITFPEFNAAIAKETLTKAGYPNGVTLKYVYAKDVQPDPPILIKQLEAAGFKINAVDDPTIDSVYSGDFDLFSAAWTSDLSDSRDLLGALLHSTEQSYSVLNDAEFDKLLADSDKELDPTKRIVLLQQANKYVADNLLWIPIRNTAYVSYFKPELDITMSYNGGGSPGVYFWKVGQKTTN